MEARSFLRIQSNIHSLSEAAAQTSHKRRRHKVSTSQLSSVWAGELVNIRLLPPSWLSRLALAGGNVLSPPSAVFFRPAQARSQQPTLAKWNLGSTQTLATLFSRQQTARRWLNSGSRVASQSVLFLRLTFSLRNFFGPKVDSYSKKNSYSQSGGKLPSKGVITYHTLISSLHSTQHI